MKKVFAMLMTLTLALSLLAGCGSSQETTEDTTGTDDTQTEETQLSGSVSTDGSTSMEEVIGALGEQFQADTGVSVTYNPTGSGSGIEAVKNGSCDIGLSARALKDEEKAAGLTETTVALDGIAIIVNAENPVTDLSIDQIAQIYTGAVTDWADMGGTAGTIAVIGRESGSGTRDGFESITETEDKCQLDQELTSTGAVIEAVRGNTAAIGYASLSAVEHQDGINAITVDGVACNEDTILDGTYKVQRPFVVITKEGVELTAQAQAFFDWAMSADAADLIRQAGAVPTAE